MRPARDGPVTWGYGAIATFRAARRDGHRAGSARASAVTRPFTRNSATELALTARLVAAFPGLKALSDRRISRRSATSSSTFSSVSRARRFSSRSVPKAPCSPAPTRPGATCGGRDPGCPALLAAPGAGAQSSRFERAAEFGRGGGASEAAGYRFGYLVAAEAIDEPFAEALSDATQDEIVVLSESARCSPQRFGRRRRPGASRGRGGPPPEEPTGSSTSGLARRPYIAARGVPACALRGVGHRRADPARRPSAPTAASSETW